MGYHTADRASGSGYSRGLKRNERHGQPLAMALVQHYVSPRRCGSLIPVTPCK
jgi:hypothetical protein